jgi:RNA polymerase sigma factor (sigma-70 family)
MAARAFHTLVQSLRKLIPRSRPTTTPDVLLLERFLDQRDEAAFELLMWRHGPMVLSVCLRVLGDPHEAEDAFQATFLTLVRKGHTIGKGELLASWLYKVASRTALRARARAARRAAGPLPPHGPAAPEQPQPGDELAWRELRPVLDDEVSRLPPKYRAAFVLCYLEGKTNEEAARLLGCPKGTVLSRLARARERLRGQLARRGLAFAALPLAGLLSDHARTLTTISPVLVYNGVQLAVLEAFGRLLGETVPESVAELLTDADEGGARGARGLGCTVAVVVLMLAVVAAAGAGLSAYDSMSTPPPLGSPGDAGRGSPDCPAGR